MDPWAILPDEQMRYEQQFVQLSPADGFITGVQAKEFFFKSNLPPPVLAQIWQLSDINRDGRLDKKEFSIAMHLIRKKLQGLEIPPTLPPSMLAGQPVQQQSAWGAMPDILPKAATSPPSMVGSVPGNVSMLSGLAHTFPQQSASFQQQPATLPHPGAFGGSQTGFAMQGGAMDGQRSRAGSSLVNDRPASAGPGMVPTGEWAVPHNIKLKYNKVFHDLDKSRAGFLNGNQARTLFVQSGLPQPLLAQIWALADIDKDGRLASEEFVLAMHLVEMARNRQEIPSVLPPDLIPPSFRRPRGMSAASVPVPIAGSASDKSVAGSSSEEAVDKYSMLASFEDKRKENFDKGQAELERRRAAIQEMQRQEREEREKKEREEFERREKLRQEQERKRQAEIEAHMARQREIQEREEEERRKIIEQREAARRELDRQRKIERQKQRRHELLNERTRVYEELAHFRSENTGIEGLENVDTDARRKDLTQLVEETRNQVRERKDIIDGMRINRDKILEDITKFTNDDQSLTEQVNHARMERQMTERRVGAGTGGVADSLQSLIFAVQQKQDAVNEIEARLAEVDSPGAPLDSQLDERNERIRSIQEKFQAIYEDHVRLLHDFQGRQNSLIQSEHQLAGQPATETHVKPAWDAEPQGLYPNLQSMQESAFPDVTQQISNGFDAWPGSNGFGNTNDSGFDVATEDVWGGESPFDQAALNSVQPTQTHVSDLRDKLEEKLSFGQVARTPSIKHERSLSFGNDFKNTKFRKFQALYAYNAGNEDELSFQPGDTIYVPDTHDGEPGWLPGELNGRTGWLPENHVQFVEEIDEIPKSSQKERPVPKSRGNSIQSDTPTLDGSSAQLLAAGSRAKAIHPWNAKKDTHLTFAKGDILLLKQKAENWYLGEKENGGGQGWFPAQCVELLPAATGLVSPQQQNLVGELKKAFHSYSSVDGGSSDGESQYVALFQYKSDIEGDLNFNAGDVITVIQKDGDWWTGKVAGRTGIFPSNYVKEHAAPELPSPASLNRAITQSQTEDHTKKKPELVVAVAPYTAGGPEQISFAKGDMVLVKKKTDTGWWEGELQAKGKQRQTGWFPAAYVKAVGGGEKAVITPGHEKGRAPSVPKVAGAGPSTSTMSIKVQAMYDYSAMNHDELTFKKNDIITIVHKEDDNWWKGTLNGKEGILPSNYVQVVGEI